MPRTQDPDAIPQRLVAAGLELFLRQGYNATGIQQIADQARVPKGSFYNHFESKDAFAAVIVSRYSEWMQRSWARMMLGAPRTPMAAIHHVFAEMIGYHERTPSAVGCLIGNFAAEIASSSPLCRKSLMAAQRGWRERLSGLITAGQAVGEIRLDIDAKTLSALTWSAWEGALLRVKVEGEVTPLRDTTNLMLDKIYPPPAEFHVLAQVPSVSTSAAGDNQDALHRVVRLNTFKSRNK
jgi:TetR/AcrR family transcriptional repressor of nem operon